LLSNTRQKNAAKSTDFTAFVHYSTFFLKGGRILDENAHAGGPANKDIAEKPVCRVGKVSFHF